MPIEHVTPEGLVLHKFHSWSHVLPRTLVGGDMSCEGHSRSYHMPFFHSPQPSAQSSATRGSGRLCSSLWTFKITASHTVRRGSNKPGCSVKFAACRLHDKDAGRTTAHGVRDWMSTRRNKNAIGVISVRWSADVGAVHAVRSPSQTFDTVRVYRRLILVARLWQQPSLNPSHSATYGHRFRAKAKDITTFLPRWLIYCLTRLKITHL